MNHLAFLIFPGNSCYRCWWPSCHPVFCLECVYRCFSVAIHSWPDETLPRLQLYISCYPFVCLLDLQWSISVSVFLVAIECRMRYIDVRWWRIPLPTNRIERNSRWLYAARYESRFIAKVGNIRPSEWVNYRSILLTVMKLFCTYNLVWMWWLKYGIIKYCYIFTENFSKVVVSFETNKLLTPVSLLLKLCEWKMKS